MLNFLRRENPLAECSIYRKIRGFKWKALSFNEIIWRKKPFHQKNLHHCRPSWDLVCSLADMIRASLGQSERGNWWITVEGAEIIKPYSTERCIWKKEGVKYVNFSVPKLLKSYCVYGWVLKSSSIITMLLILFYTDTGVPLLNKEQIC